MPRHRMLRPCSLLAGAGALALALGGCGSGAAQAPAKAVAVNSTTCRAIVLSTLTEGVLARVYHEGVDSERTIVAARVIAASAALREAVAAGDAPLAREAAKKLVSEGHITALQVTRNGRVLASVGGPAVAPLSGTIVSSGKTVGTYVTSVWSDDGLKAEGEGITHGLIAIRRGNRSVGGTARLGPLQLPAEGVIARAGRLFEYRSLQASAFPSGAARIYLLEPKAHLQAQCGNTEAQTVENTLKVVALTIYKGEVGPPAHEQVLRVQSDVPLLEAVQRHEVHAAKKAINAILNHHLVRLRVLAGGTVLADVGGPYVLAPVRAPLRLRGHRIGSLVLSVQDDEGYKRLTGRLAGLSVLMYLNGQLVKNSLGPDPGAVPAEGAFTYDGRDFDVFTLQLGAFPSGPLVVRVLVPVPYSLAI